jgi:hypothetical protein
MNRGAISNDNSTIKQLSINLGNLNLPSSLLNYQHEQAPSPELSVIPKMSFEKKDALVSEDATISPPSEQIIEESEIYIDPIAEAKVLRKCDMYLVPLLTIAFLSAYLDRSNIGNAATAGLLTDTHMSSQQYASKT